jgi:hypothetical protein
VRFVGVIEKVRFSDEIRLFRERAYLRGPRNPEWIAAWATDALDVEAAHFVVRDSVGELAGALRVHLETGSALFARMAVRRREIDGRRVQIDLLLHASRYAVEAGCQVGSAVVNAGVVALYRRLSVPFSLEEEVDSRGEPMFGIRWDLHLALPLLESVVDVSRAVPLPG